MGVIYFEYTNTTFSYRCIRKILDLWGLDMNPIIKQFIPINLIGKIYISNMLANIIKEIETNNTG